MTKPTILIVDDNDELKEIMQENLESDGFAVQCAASAADLLDRLKGVSVDTILLDLNLPDGDGLSLIGEIRKHTGAPVIVVSGKVSLVDRVVGLEMGADDYIAKPFEMRELSARIRAHLRRHHDEGAASVPAQDLTEKNCFLHFGRWILDRNRLQAFDEAGRSADLTVKEYRLLEALALAPNRVLSRAQLLDLSRDNNLEVFDRAIDIQITRIRKKIGDDARASQMIKTVRGAGYMYCCQRTRSDVDV